MSETVEMKVRKAPKENTKQAKAVEIFKRMNGSKEAVTTIMQELGMSKAGATTYFYNAKKLSNG